MTTEETLTAILASVQVDVGHRGLNETIFAYRRTDFAAACRDLATHPRPQVQIITGFTVITSTGTAIETDGPLGAGFLARAFSELGITSQVYLSPPAEVGTHLIALECVGPSCYDGRCRSMSARDVTDFNPNFADFVQAARNSYPETRSIGIGDGGNEIGMGLIPQEIIARTIPNGERIACRLATDWLIVAGVSNWGAYALAAGVATCRGRPLPVEMFNPDRELARLQELVQQGFVDGVTGLVTPSVDGLAFAEYVAPLVAIGRLPGVSA